MKKFIIFGICELIRLALLTPSLFLKPPFPVKRKSH